MMDRTRWCYTPIVPNISRNPRIRSCWRMEVAVAKLLFPRHLRHHPYSLFPFIASMNFDDDLSSGLILISFTRFSLKYHLKQAAPFDRFLRLADLKHGPLNIALWLHNIEYPFFFLLVGVRIDQSHWTGIRIWPHCFTKLWSPLPKAPLYRSPLHLPDRAGRSFRRLSHLATSILGSTAFH